MLRNLLLRTRPVHPREGSKVLVASEGRSFGEDVLQLAARISREGGGQVRVLAVARLWGTGFGLPNPGLRPSKREMSEQEENVGRAIARLEELGVAADGHIVITRNPRKSILREAVRHGCAAIVMGADPQRNWLIGSMMWSQEPYRVRRGAPIPVHLVETSAATAARSRMEPASKAPAKLRLVLNEKNIHHS